MPYSLYRRPLQASAALVALLLGGTSAHALSLEGALKQTYETNPQLYSERRALGAIDERMAMAVSEWRPTVDASYSTGRQRISYGGAPDTYGDKGTTQLMVNQPIFNGGGSIARYRGSELQVQAGRAQLNAVTQQVLLQAISSYMDVLRDKAIVDLSVHNAKVLQDQKGATGERFKVGEVTRTDVAQSEARLARAVADLSQAKGDLARSMASFKRVIGSSPDRLTVPRLLPVLPNTLEAALSQAEAANPNLRRAKFTADASEKQVSAQKAALLPTVALQGYIRREDGVGGVFGNADYDNDAVLLNVNVPLYQSGAEYARVREARQNRERAKFDALDTQNEVTARVVQAWEGFHTSQASIRAHVTAIRSAEQVLDGVKQEQKYGARTVLDVLDAEQELYVARVGLVRAQRDEVVSSYAILAETGRLHPQSLGMDVVVYDPDENLERVKFRPIGF